MTRELWVLELNISEEAVNQTDDRNWYELDENGDYWVIHAEEDSDRVDHPCAFETREEALELATFMDHESRVTRYVPETKESRNILNFARSMLRYYLVLACGYVYEKYTHEKEI